MKKYFNIFMHKPLKNVLWIISLESIPRSEITRLKGNEKIKFLDTHFQITLKKGSINYHSHASM